MTTPTTDFDARFSSPGASGTSWEEAVAVLEAAQMSWLTTVRADGRPHVTPLVALWLDGTAYFSTGAEEQKARNLEANPNVVLTTGSDDWERGLDVVVEGRAVRTTDEATLQRLVEAYAQKWDGTWQYEVGDSVLRQRSDGAGGAAAEGGEALVFAVEPAKVLAFGKGTFTQTAHRF